MQMNASSIGQSNQWTTQLNLFVLMNIARRMKPEIQKGKRGFVQDAETRNAIFIFRIVSGRVV